MSNQFGRYEIFDLLDATEAVCAKIGHTKEHQLAILSSATEELGELATEVRIEHGLKPREGESSDGIAGEAVDLVLCGLDMLYTEYGSLNHPDIARRVSEKLEKWLKKYG